MINSQEIIERSIYSSLLRVTKLKGYTIDPNDYLPVSTANQKRYEEDVKKIMQNKGTFISIFGTANNASKDIKKAPRIVVDARGFYPGGIGIDKVLLENEEGAGFTITEEPYNSIDQFINIHLVANNQEELRLLHQLTFLSIPVKGYIKPYTEDKLLVSGNIFINLLNFYDSPAYAVSLMEKVYEFVVEDTLIGENETDIKVPPLRDISVLMDKYDTSISPFIGVKFP